MVLDHDQVIQQQLDRLDASGRCFWHARFRGEALARSGDLMLPLLPVLALLVLAAVLVGAFSAADAFVGMLIVLLTLLAGTYRYWRRKLRSGRIAHLALFDARLGANNRIVTADEFMAKNSRSGFEEAAVLDAAPWIEKALGIDLSLESHPWTGRRRAWPYLACTALLLVLAGWLPVSLQMPSLLAEKGAITENIILPPQADVLSVNAAPPMAAAPLGKAGEGRSASSANHEPAPSNRGGKGQGQGQSATGQGSYGQGAQGNAGQARSPSAASAKASAAKTPGKAATHTAQPAVAANAEATPSSSAEPSSAAGSDGEAAADAKATTAQGRSASSAEKPMAANNSNAKQQGAGRKNATSHSQKGNPSQGQGQGNSNKGNQGQSQGSQEGIKKSRGVAGILLAVPMEDQLLGTANKGRISSSTEQVFATASGQQPGAAQSRGQLNGSIEQAPQPQASQQELQLIKRFFLMPPDSEQNDNH